MAEKRMFSKKIIDSDAFLDMPLSTQALYFHLSMRADDEGFINNAKKIQRMIGASDDDLKVLITKKFIIPFASGIVVVKHWYIHNYIRKDRLQPTAYTEEKSSLYLKGNGAYTTEPDIDYQLTAGDCQTDDGHMSVACQSDDGQATVKCPHSIDKIRLDKNSIDKSSTPLGAVRMKRPSLQEIQSFILENKLEVDADSFFNHYESNGWKVGNRAPMKDWKASVRYWDRQNKNRKQFGTQPKASTDYIQRTYDQSVYDDRMKKAVASLSEDDIP